MNLNQRFQLPDGRTLGYNEYGSPNGKPIFYFHGSPSARIEFDLFGNDALLQSIDARLIAVDRPGMGLSTFQAGRNLLDFSKDLLALADHLKIEKFSILAYSLGGPYGLACAYAIPERLNKVGIVSGAAFFTKPELMTNINEGTQRYLDLPRENPWTARMFLWVLGAMARLAPKMAVKSAAALMPEPDRVIVQEIEIQKGFIAMVREALRQGVAGAFHESLLSISDPGFRIQDIHTPILLWHGEIDQNIPVAMARYAAAELPNCEAQFFPQEGHLSVFKQNTTEIIQAMLNENPVWRKE